MNWATEKDIRMFIVKHILNKAVVLNELYGRLEEEASSKRSEIKIDVKDSTYALAAVNAPSTRRG